MPYDHHSQGSLIDGLPFLLVSPVLHLTHSRPNKWRWDWPLDNGILVFGTCVWIECEWLLAEQCVCWRFEAWLIGTPVELRGGLRCDDQLCWNVVDGPCSRSVRRGEFLNSLFVPHPPVGGGKNGTLKFTLSWCLRRKSTPQDFTELVSYPHIPSSSPGGWCNLLV